MFEFLQSLWFRIRARFRRDELDAELVEEMKLHQELLREEAMRGGASPNEARRQAAWRFGNTTNVRERARTAWSFGSIESILQDLNYAIRFLRRSPAFTTVAVLSLALGIGANATVFAVADRLLFSAPPHISNPDGLFVLNVKRTSQSRPEAPYYPVAHFPEFFMVRDQMKSLSALALYTPPSRVRLGRGPEAPRIKESVVSGNFFEVLGVRPARGRFFQPDDDTDSRSVHAAVVSHSFWQRQYGGADSVLGARFSASDIMFEIVGVTPSGFSGLEIDAADVWVPLAAAAPTRFGEDWKEWRGNVPHVVARLQPGVAASAASAEATVILNRLPDREDRAPTIESASFGSVIEARGPSEQSAAVKVSTRLVVAAILVMVAACANLANLLLVRAITRRREIALRLAIGISRSRLVSQMLLESLLIAFAGSVAALFAANWGGSALRALVFPDMQWASGTVNVRVFAFSMLCGTLTAVLATLAPAIRMTRANVGRALRSGSQQSTASSGRLRQGLLVVQVALSILLIVGASAFSRSLSRAYEFDMGIDVDRLVTTRLFLETDSLNKPARLVMLEEAARRIRQIRGVEFATIADAVPLTGARHSQVFLPDRELQPTTATSWTVTPELLQTAGFRLVKGRFVTAQDVAPGMPAKALITETGARTLWPGTEAVGRCVRFRSDTAPCLEIAGVIRDLRPRSLRDEPSLSLLITRREPELAGALSAYVIVRSALGVDANDLVGPIRLTLQRLRADLNSIEVRPLSQALDSDFRPLKLGAATFGSFAVLALVLAAIGLYGILAFSVTQRTGEFGIRAALGARAAHLVRSVVGEGLLVVFVGASTGALLSWYASTAIATLLFESSARDVAPYAYAAAILSLVAFAASALPAWRATRIDPASALRAE